MPEHDDFLQGQLAVAQAGGRKAHIASFGLLRHLEHLVLCAVIAVQLHTVVGIHLGGEKGGVIAHLDAEEQREAVREETAFQIVRQHLYLVDCALTTQIDLHPPQLSVVRGRRHVVGKIHASRTLHAQAGGLHLCIVVILELRICLCCHQTGNGRYCHLAHFCLHECFFGFKTLQK